MELRIVSMVQVNTLSLLGHTEPGEVADENLPIGTTKHQNLYQKTKFAADQLARENAAKGLPIKIVYPAFSYSCFHLAATPAYKSIRSCARQSGNQR
jgi:thioester reductase-like protein